MAYRVELSPEADREIEEAYRWIAAASPRGAHRWFNGLMDALRSLSDFPQRCPPAPESDAFVENIRQLLYGRRQHRYRALFAIRGKTVQVLHIRHGARRHLGSSADVPPEDE